jgi:hypothetical protein
VYAVMVLGVLQLYWTWCACRQRDNGPLVRMDVLLYVFEPLFCSCLAVNNVCMPLSPEAAVPTLKLVMMSGTSRLRSVGRGNLTVTVWYSSPVGPVLDVYCDIALGMTAIAIVRRLVTRKDQGGQQSTIHELSLPTCPNQPTPSSQTTRDKQITT